jgi:hypothetical protein
MKRMRRLASRSFLQIAAGASMLACTPTLDWRDVRPADCGLLLQFPCRPSAHERSLLLAGGLVRLSLYACNAGGQTWALSTADVGDPARVGATLGELRRSTAANVQAKEDRTLPLGVTGATPVEGAVRVLLSGHRPDGRAVKMQMALFAHGTRVFQATALGERAPGEAAETFFSSLRFER